MAVSKITRRADALGQVGYPNANTIRVDSDDDTLKFGTGASGMTEKTVVDLSSTQTITGDKTFSGTVTLSGAITTELADGSASTPSLNFSADTDSGLYRIGANDIALAVGGVKTVGVTAGTLTVEGIEAGDGAINLYADNGDDNPDKWTLKALAASETLEISNANVTAKVNVTAGQVAVLGNEAGNAAILLDADEGDDNADSWFIQSTASDNDLDFINHTTTNMSLSSGGNLTVTGSVDGINIPKTVYCTTQFDATSGTTGTTLTNVIGMVHTVVAGTYNIDICVPGVSTANSGAKYSWKLTTTVLGSCRYDAVGMTATAVKVEQGTTATDQPDIFSDTAAYVYTRITGRAVVTTGGTMQFQAAQNASHADTTSVYVGASMTFTRVA